MFEGKRSFSFTVDVELVNENRKVIGKNSITLQTGTLRFAAGNKSVIIPDGDAGLLLFPNVNVNDLSPTLTIVISAVNGIASSALADLSYMKIDAGNLEGKTLSASSSPTGQKRLNTISPEAARLNTLGVSAGSSFAAPLFIGTVRGTFSPLPYSFAEIGLDIGFQSTIADSSYYSLYPFVHYALFIP